MSDPDDDPRIERAEHDRDFPGWDSAPGEFDYEADRAADRLIRQQEHDQQRWERAWIR